jgi:hypothetical protein
MQKETLLDKKPIIGKEILPDLRPNQQERRGDNSCLFLVFFLSIFCSNQNLDLKDRDSLLDRESLCQVKTFYLKFSNLVDVFWIADV